MSGEAVLEVEHVTVRYPGSRRLALKDVFLDVQPGETIGLLGHNGSGKSTFVKVLAGIVQPTAEAVCHFRGAALGFPIDATRVRRSGLVFVHQDLGLVAGMSVLENICVGDYDRLRGTGIIDRKAARRRVRDVLEELGLRIWDGARLADVDPGDRVLVAIARALDGLNRRSGSAGVLVLDEATAGLHIQQREIVLNAIARLKRDGLGIVMVTHRLDEVSSLCSRVTVLRDGEVVSTASREDGMAMLSEDHLTNLIRGQGDPSARVDTESLTRQYSVDSTLEKSVVNFSDVGCSDHVHICVSAGEGSILGVTGLPDSGVLEFAEALSGQADVAHGQISIQGVVHHLGAGESRSKHKSGVRSAVAFVPSERRDAGLSLGLSVEENVCMVRMKELTGYLGLFKRRQSLQMANDLITDYGVRGGNANTVVSRLSGGNQQKLLIGKWLELNRPVVVIDEPTQGVDVGARADIYQTLRSAARTNGMTVIVISTDIQELVQLCDTVAIIRDGVCGAVLSGTSISDAAIRASL